MRYRQWLQGTLSATFLASTDILTLHRYTPHPGGYQSAVSLSEDYAARSRREIDVDEPSLDGLQAALLLVIAFVGSGKGKKAYMLLSKYSSSAAIE